jgi:hypothetical protein
MASMTADATTLTTAGNEADVARVEQERVTDPVTGLPVMRYRFAGPPTLRPGMAAPTGAWRVLRVEERDGQTTLDLETAAGAEPLDAHPSAVDDAVVEAAVATLRLARACGAVHGDLGPRRLWRRGTHVWVEGYGVRWRDDADGARDARDLAAGLLNLPGTRLSAAGRARLRAILDSGDVDAVAAPPPPPSAGADGGPAAPAGAPPDPDEDAAPGRVVRGPPPGSLVRRGGIGIGALVARVAQQWWSGAPRAGFRPEVRLRLAVALLVASATWVGLASWGGRAAPSGRSSTAVGGHVVDVTVVPPGQPPVGLVVVASPPGSSLAVGSVIASVPGKVWLDLAGRWRFEARFGERRSPTVELVVPFERALQLAFPTPAAP